jgi:diacylglycerol O-acyltransferase / wax synthase
MPYSHYDRLSAVDSLFLEIEEPRVHMHIGAVALFDADPLTTAAGTLDFERIRVVIEAALDDIPRFRQRLERVPILGHPVWVDDRSFNLDYHLRHTALPRPGDLRTLKRLAGRILSQQLDRGKPLWEMWVVEGVEPGRFALIMKAHHCMVDGIAGFELLTRILSPDPAATPQPGVTWYPRPAPTGTRLLRDELMHRAAWPLSMLQGAARLVREPGEAVADLQEAMLAAGEVLGIGLAPTSATALNPEIGPHRRFDWTRFELETVKEVKKHLGGTLNDVVLASVAGAVGRFLRRRGERVDGLRFRAQVPMSIRGDAEQGQGGNRIVMLLCELPVDEPDPRRRLARVIETTERLKSSRQRAGIELFEELSDRTLGSVFVRVAQFATRQRAFNLVVTNVPGPPMPVYLLGARMLEIHPLVPLAANQALGIALFSYDGGLNWGFNADWDALPDLHDFVSGLEQEFASLHAAAMAAAGPGAS